MVFIVQIGNIFLRLAEKNFLRSHFSFFWKVFYWVKLRVLSTKLKGKYHNKNSMYIVDVRYGVIAQCGPQAWEHLRSALYYRPVSNLGKQQYNIGSTFRIFFAQTIWRSLAMTYWIPHWQKSAIFLMILSLEASK